MPQKKERPPKICKKCGKEYDPYSMINICDKCIRELPDENYLVNISGLVKSSK